MTQREKKVHPSQGLIQNAQPKPALLFLMLLYLAFIALGLPDTGLGVAWNQMREDFGVPLEYAGFITMTITVCSAISGFVNGSLLNRYGTGRVTAVSCTMTALAILGFAVSESYWLILLLAVPLGLGAGAVDAGLNSYAAENLSSKHMNWLHSSWGIGATLSPIILTVGISNFGSWKVGYGFIGVVILCLSLSFFMTLSFWKQTKQGGALEEEREDKPWIGGIAPFLSVLAYIVYVAVEGGLGLWLSALLVESRGLNLSAAGFLTGGFFGSIMIGRFLMGFIADRLGNRKLIVLGLVISALGSAAFFSQQHAFIYGTGIFLLGLGFAPLYPAMMHETSKRFGTVQSKKVIGYQVAFSYISLLTFVPLIGYIASRTSLEFIPVFTAISVAALALVIKTLNRLT
ncbi:MFS transporter [Metabacillus sp. JX24]|uniref:MFS transporter n=1 Tax=Metabacillus sp. JX24 TaxID=3240759 RepID=UPI00350F7F0F